MKKEAWAPPTGFRKAGVVIREEHLDFIAKLAARTGRPQYEVMDAALARGLDGVVLPAAVDLAALMPRAKKKKL